MTLGSAVISWMIPKAQAAKEKQINCTSLKLKPFVH